MTGVLFEDFVRPLFRKPISEAKASFYMKVIVVIIGTVTVILATIVDKLGGIIQVIIPRAGIVSICKPKSLMRPPMVGTLLSYESSENFRLAQRVRM